MVFLLSSVRCTLNVRIKLDNIWKGYINCNHSFLPYQIHFIIIIVNQKLYSTISFIFFGKLRSVCILKLTKAKVSFNYYYRLNPLFSAKPKRQMWNSFYLMKHRHLYHIDGSEKTPHPIQFRYFVLCDFSR